MKHEVPKGGSVGVGGWGEGKRAETNFSGIWQATSHSVTTQHGIVEFCAYFAEWSGTHVFDQQRYATAAKNCLELCLYNHRNFSKGGLKDSGGSNLGHK